MRSRSSGVRLDAFFMRRCFLRFSFRINFLDSASSFFAFLMFARCWAISASMSILGARVRLRRPGTSTAGAAAANASKAAPLVARANVKGAASVDAAAAMPCARRSTAWSVEQKHYGCGRDDKVLPH